MVFGLAILRSLGAKKSKSAVLPCSQKKKKDNRIIMPWEISLKEACFLWFQISAFLVRFLQHHTFCTWVQNDYRVWEFAYSCALGMIFKKKKTKKTNSTISQWWLAGSLFQKLVVLSNICTIISEPNVSLNTWALPCCPTVW